MNQQQRIKLGNFPTPCVSAPDLGELVGVDELWVKRDDLTGYSWGGNKVRTIEYLLRDVINQGSDTVVVCGGPISNFAALISVACTHYGLAVHRISYGTPPAREPAALAFSIHSGAIVEYTGSSDRSSMGVAAEAVAVRLRAEGKCPYVVPRGGATAVGALGFANAALELSDQLESIGIDKLTVVLPVGSGGSIAGLIAGWAYALDNANRTSVLKVEIVGVSVSRAPTELTDIVACLASDCAIRAGYGKLRLENERCRWRLVDGRGAGYGVANEREDILIDEIGSRTRFLVDTTYNGKSLAWLRESSNQLIGPVVYWHTGGALGVVDRISERDVSQVYHLREGGKQDLLTVDTNLRSLGRHHGEPAASIQKVVDAG